MIIFIFVFIDDVELNFNTIPTVPASSVGITTSVSSSSSTNIPTEGAVYLEEDRAALIEHLASKHGDGAVEHQRVVVGDEESQMRLMTEYVVAHLGLLAVADIRRIAHDYIELGRRRNIKHINLFEQDIGIELTSIRHRLPQRVVRQIPCRYDGIGHQLLQRYGYTSAARSDVENGTAVFRLAVGNNPINQILGFGARNEHSGSNRKGESAEFSLAKNILNRLAF